MSDARFKVTYRLGEGVDPRVWTVDVLDGLKASEIIAMKKATGGVVSGLTSLLAGLMELDMEAMKALLWVLLKKDMSTLSYEDLDFTPGQLEVNYVDDMTPERERLRLEQMAAEDNLNPAGQKRLRELIDAGVEREAPDPKA